MSAQAFAIREYRSADENHVLDLLRQSLGERAFDRSNSFWQWKHFDNPFGPSLLMLAVNDDAPVGLRAFMRWRFRVDGRFMTAVRAVDTATHPSSRRSGVFATLTGMAVERAQREGVDLIFNTPNRFSLPGYLKMGWRFVGRPHLLVKPIRPGRLIRALVARADGRGEVPLVPGTPAMPVAALLASPQTLEPLLVENDRLCGNWIRTDRSMAFLSWRYASVPSLPYYACQRGSGPAASLAIFRPNRRQGLREIMLSELMLGPMAQGTVRALIGDVINSVEADYLVAHAPWGSRHWRALLRAGFLPIPRLGPYFTVRPLSPTAATSTLTRSTGWHLSLGDLEVF